MGSPHDSETTPSDPLVSVIVPAFNEEGNIPDCVNQVSTALSSAAISHEILIVNDGSTDDTLRQAHFVSLSSSSVRVIDLGRNFGKRVALREGIRHAKGELVALFDADLQYRPDDLVSMIQMMADGVDFVSGSRNYAEYGVSRTILSKLYNAVVRLLFQVNLADSNCGIKVLKRNVARTQRILDYGVPLFVPFLKLHGFKSKELPVPLRARRKGESKYFKQGRFLGGGKNIRELVFSTVKLMSLIVHAPLELRRTGFSSEADGNPLTAQGNPNVFATGVFMHGQVDNKGQLLFTSRHPLQSHDRLPHLD